MTASASHPSDSQALDALTGGAFSAPTSGDRAARVREWLATDPSPEQMQEVFRELSARDKGAAKPLREKLDELKRAKAQASLALEWAARLKPRRTILTNMHIDLDFATLSARLPPGVEPAFDGLRFEHALG